MNIKIKITMSLLLLLQCICYADTATYVTTSQAALVTPRQINFEECSKIFKLNTENLFYLTISAINANNFTLKEMQTDNGYLIFKAAGKDYLATIAKVDNTNSILKITPCNNIYYFQNGIVLNIFKYIELNSNQPIK